LLLRFHSRERAIARDDPETEPVALKVMERCCTGITRLAKDKYGNLLIPVFSKEEIADILAECELEYN
jgi:hypothetical protein